MKWFKKDFPLFANNPDIIYLDSAASIQKPKSVIDAMSHYLSHDYSNIHRWLYDLAMRSEDLFDESKKAYARLINAHSSEIIYTYNASYAFNMLAQVLVRSGELQAGDTVLVAIHEHHANIVPWQILQDYWVHLEFVGLTENFELDMQDFTKKYTDTVKVVSLNHISNSTWTIQNLDRVRSLLRNDTLFVVDWSQSVQHIAVDVAQIWCDVFVATWHKLLAATWLWMLWAKKELLEKWTPAWWAWDTIKDVTEDGFTFASSPTKYEPWTPHVLWAVSLLAACRYIEDIGGLATIESYENHLMMYTLSKFQKIQKQYGDEFMLVWKQDASMRIWIFSFVIHGLGPKTVWEYFAREHICIRSWWHCTHPLMHKVWLEHGTCRMSLYIYNTTQDIDEFFRVFKKILRLARTWEYKDHPDDMCV